jgi:Protein of unknown function (DUF1524)
VDHIVAFDLWNNKLAACLGSAPGTDGEQRGLQTEDLRPRVNEIGNCMLLEKNFNLSKSNSSLKEFLEGVHEFKERKLELADWAAGMDLDMLRQHVCRDVAEAIHRSVAEDSRRS